MIIVSVVTGYFIHIKVAWVPRLIFIINNTDYTEREKATSKNEIYSLVGTT